jgi:catalase
LHQGIAYDSNALQLIGKMKDTLMGRTIGILIAAGSEGEAIKIITALCEVNYGY